jgi:hypothetical protein
MCRFHVAPRVEETIWVTLEINAGPLYECKVRGSPNQGIMSLIRWSMGYPWWNQMKDRERKREGR